MAFITKDQILEADDLASEAVDVPEWGGTVIVRTMTGADRDQFETSMVTTLPDGTRKSDLTNLRAKLVALTLVDAAGTRMFDASDVDRLGLKSAGALERVFVVAQRINGLGGQAEDDALKNSKADLVEGSPSV